MKDPILLSFLGHTSIGVFLVKLLLNTLALFVAAYLLKGVFIKDFTRAIILALVLALLNSTLGAVLNFLTAPLNWITLGLFSLVVDAIVLMIAAYFLKGFEIKSFVWAVFLAITLAIFNAILHLIFL